MSKRKSKPMVFGSMLLADRFSCNNTPKATLFRGTVTEYTGISKLSESLDTRNKIIRMPGSEGSSNSILEKYSDIFSILDFSLSIPPRLPFGIISKEEYKQAEQYAFNRWKGFHKDAVFEHNIELWRQFWITCERADTIAQIVDSRDPEFFINRDIFLMYPDKKHLILYNKADLISGDWKMNEGLFGDNVGCYFYSSKGGPFDYMLNGTVGLIGYPNVGKSSTINHILRQKRVRVSSTPGKTKHIQTIETPGFTLMDCPGLVFPKYSKIDLTLHGVLNVDHLTELNKYEGYIVDYIGRTKLCNYYKLSHSTGDILCAIADVKSWPKNKCLKYMIKDYVDGCI
ncbi:large subunit GTPase 1 [Pancytospora epiphaga]|nr:large subunit GTPase 1 [Pancytospora epiphaga]